MFYEVMIKRIEDNYAFIKGDRFIIGEKKVKLDKLCIKPSEVLKRELINIQEGIDKAEKELYSLKNKGEY